MRSRSRRELARIAAPAAFLLGLTVAVLLIRAGLGGGGSGPGVTVPSVPTTPSTVATTPATTQRHTTTPAGRFYTVQSGDTFGSIAAQFGTSVQKLEQLNPGVSSNALTVGQRIRVQ
ncbi:MAG TPA: LysM domain-containing protein [Gaiellaceae bacterium]